MIDQILGSYFWWAQDSCVSVQTHSPLGRFKDKLSQKNLVLPEAIWGAKLLLKVYHCTCTLVCRIDINQNSLSTPNYIKALF